jgi:AcrR family transcriptional regulator
MMGSMSDAAALPRRPGRPRDARAEGAIIAAVFELIGEVGFAGLTIEAVAARAGVGKATIYRRWCSRDELVLAALGSLHTHLDVQDTGDLAADLSYCLGSLCEMIETLGPALFGGLLAQSAVNDDLAALVHEFVQNGRAPLRELLRKAQANGQLAADVKIEDALDMLAGGVLFKSLVLGERLDRRVAKRLVDALLSPTPS